MPFSKLRVRTIQFTFLPDTYYKSDINPVGCIRVHLRLRSLFLICALNVIHSEISSETQLHFKKSSVAYAYIPRHRKPRQEDCHKFKANLGYIVSSRSACYGERHSVLTTEGQSIGNGS